MTSSPVTSTRTFSLPSVPDKKYIYVLSDPAHIKEGKYKVGSHGGNMDDLITRYITALPEVQVFCFIETAIYSMIEAIFKSKYSDKRVGNVRGHGSEWYKLKLQDILDEILRMTNILISLDGTSLYPTKLLH